MINRTPWFERTFQFGGSAGMLPFHLERLEGTIFRIEQRVKNVPDKILSEKYDGKWSVKQNIGHLAEVDLVNNNRIDQMLNGTPVMLPAVFEPQDYNPWPIDKLLLFFRETRLNNIRKYLSLSEAQLKMSSVHPRLKVAMNPVDLAMFDGEHDDHHLLKIADILKEHSS